MAPNEAVDPATFRQFFDRSRELLAVADADGRFQVVNPAWQEVLGWSDKQLLAQSLAQFIHPDDVADTMAEIGHLSEDLQSVSFLNRFRHAEGGYRHLRWSLSIDPSGSIFALARDVTDHRRAVADAKNNEELWRAVLATAADPVILIDRNGSILEANQATTTLFGYSGGELVGKNVSMLMPEPDRSQHDGYIDRYLDTGDARIIGIGREVQARRADASVFPIHLAISEVVTDNGPVFTGIIHDLTELHAAARGLQEANERLEERVTERTTALEASMTELSRSNRDLEQFAYIASHDLQAPLRNVRQGLELLDEHLVSTVGEGFDGEAQELRGLVLASVGRMEDLINGLLSYSRVHRQSNREHTPVDLDEVVEEVLAQLHPDLEESGLSIAVAALPTVDGDRLQFEQLFQNLLANAIKYRSDGPTPEVNVSTTENADNWLISIADNGIGIDETQHNRIFELFRRGHANYEGVGIGLAICQRIVERHGGEIWVRSEPGQGATFTFSVPKEASP